MTPRVLLVAASAAFLIGMAVRLRPDRTQVRGDPIEPLTDWGVETAEFTEGIVDVIDWVVHTADRAMEFTEGIVDDAPAPTGASFVAAVVPPAPTTKLLAKSSFVYKATLKLPKATSEILIVGSDDTAPAGSVTWSPWFYRQFLSFLSPNVHVTCFVGDENLEWTLNVFPKVQELVKQADSIKNQNQSSEADAAIMDWIKRYNHKNHIAGFEVNEALTSADFPALHETINREYDVIEPFASGIKVALYSLFKQVSVASKRLVSVRFMEDLSDANKYIEKEFANMQQDVQNKISQLRPAYLRGDAYTYFEILPFLLSKTNEVRSIQERNRKWARSIHNSIQSAEGELNLAVVVVGAAHLGRSEETTPDSILDAFESLGYGIIPVDMSADNVKRKTKRKRGKEQTKERTEQWARAKAAWAKANA